jgi:tetratricopeptide (TPR) repeat protein
MPRIVLTVALVCGMFLLVGPLSPNSFGTALPVNEGEQDAEMVCSKDDSLVVKDKGRNKKLSICYASNGSQNGDIYVMLGEGKKSRCVLSAQGSAAGFVKGSKAMPDIEVSWHMSADENPSSLYAWNGHEYEERAAKPVKKVAKKTKKALELFQAGKVEEAVKAWEEAREQSPTSISAEDYNNLGFAYYTLGKRSNPQENFAKAHNALDVALQLQPNRWTAHLNLADLYVAENMFPAAIESYQKVLELKPDYKRSGVLREKISQLKLEPKAVGVEVIAMRHPSGEKDITYTRLDAHRVMQRGYFTNGQMRFEECRRDGLPDGPYQSWFDNGQLAVTGSWHLGKAVGTWEYFGEGGKLTQRLIHHEDGPSTDVTPK